jgi:Zn-dependent protease
MSPLSAWTVPLIAQSRVEFHPDRVLYYAVAALIALVVHEYAHAFVATRLGDYSPRSMGRLTLNPKAHADTFGTLVFPAILLLIVLFRGDWSVFAYAKPMPVNPWNLRKQSRDIVWIQVAGPLANLALAFIFGAVLVATCGTTVVGDFVAILVVTNVFFAAIHVIPMPPLDGARAISPFLPPRAREVMTNLEQYAPLFILLVFFILGGFFFDIVFAIARGISSLMPGRACLFL